MRLTSAQVKSLLRPNQNFLEWKKYLEFVGTHLKSFDIARPLVLELGVQRGYQRAFYERFWNAEWIGVDVDAQYVTPTVVGDTLAESTFEMVRAAMWARGREGVDVLFIDTNHTYEQAMAEYELYGPLVNHVVAFHDIYSFPEVGRAFETIRGRERGNPDLVFVAIGAWQGKTYQPGIGLIIKEKNVG